jgi:hypothetical protein
MKKTVANDRALRAEEYASAKDFCAIFQRDMRSLYLLALMLTGSEAKAEVCFAGAFEDCQASTRVFKPWANSWSKLRVIDYAVRAVNPRGGKSAEWLTERDDTNRLPAELANVLELEDFRRFVYVLTVLEQYSVRDAAILLKHNAREIALARSQAIELLGKATIPDTALFAERVPAALTA